MGNGKSAVFMAIAMMVSIMFGKNAFAEEYYYDDFNRLIKVVYEEGAYVEYEYDKNGNILKIYDSREKETKPTSGGGSGSNSGGNNGGNSGGNSETSAVKPTIADDISSTNSSTPLDSGSEKENGYGRRSDSNRTSLGLEDETQTQDEEEGKLQTDNPEEADAWENKDSTVEPDPSGESGQEGEQEGTQKGFFSGIKELVKNVVEFVVEAIQSFVEWMIGLFE